MLNLVTLFGEKFWAKLTNFGKKWDSSLKKLQPLEIKFFLQTKIGGPLPKIMVKNIFLQIISIWVPFERSHQTELKYVFF